ncbi:MAG: DUF1592 domain-containing protein, partial [Pseudomonadota bacterium]
MVAVGSLLSSAASSAEHDVAEPSEHFLATYCSACHNDEDWAGSLSFDYLPASSLHGGDKLPEWEKILRKTRLGEMPPADQLQPPPEAMAAFRGWLENSLDNRAVVHPDPGRATLRRLNRSEYGNAVRDLLALDVDVSAELPPDDSGYGFDNIADVLSVSPTLMDRYIAVAETISRLAVGAGPQAPVLVSYTVPKDGASSNHGVPAYNERSNEALPLDSRGGGAFPYYAPYDGIYEISGHLNANTNNDIERLPEDEFSLRVPLKAGAHMIGMAFRKELALDDRMKAMRNEVLIVKIPPEPARELTLDFIVDGARVDQTLVPSYVVRPRFSQNNYPRDVMQIDVKGPFDISGPGKTDSIRKIFVCEPTAAAESENACARKILSILARQAYRRPVTDTDVALLMRIYTIGRDGADFRQGIAAALQAMLISPHFLFLQEKDPVDSAPGSVHAISDLEFASRLALFLWSSLPDEALLRSAEAGTLRKPAELQAQVSRMLADPRAHALVENFAGQWLYLRNLDLHQPDRAIFPQYDVRLQQAMKQETELFFSYVVNQNRSILEFLDADYTFLNQRLAEHYGIDGVKGTAFRKVALPADSPRGGLLGQGSILTVTSYGNHTSVVKRGKWILENLLASAPPPPPPDVPALKTSQNGKALNAREQMAMHRADPVCASCHVKMDPMGFALEQFDAVGGYRTHDAGQLVDVASTMPDGTQFTGMNGLKDVLLAQSDEFVLAFTERLLTY